MKKLLSILLIGAIFCSLPSLQAFASSSVAEQSSLSEIEKEMPSVNECTDFTVLDESLPNLDHYDSNLSTDTFFSQNQAFSKKSITFNETSETFLQKITSDTLEIDGYIAEENHQSLSLTDYFTQNKASRFDIVEIAHQNNLITESEKIETYCNLIENQQFENASCLHSVILMLLQYQSSETSSEETKERIEQIFSPSSSVSTYSTSRSASDDENLPSYSSSNFIVEYEAGIAYSEVIKVANYLETVRNKYVNEMEYRAPILESSQTKYRVTLRTGASNDPDNPFGVTFPIDCYGVTYSTCIEIYHFTSLTAQFEEVVAHELFHAIQGAYYWNTFLSNIWFSEATAAWATIEIQETTSAISEEINGYLDYNDSLVYFYYMGTVLFPLVMQDLCDTSDVIREVWEEYGTLTSTNSMLDDLRDVIDTALAPYGESFDSVYLTMGYYNFSPSYWYSSIYPLDSTVTDTWIPRIDTTTNTVSRPRNTINVRNSQNELVHSIEAHCHKYHQFIPDKTGQNSKIVIEIEYVDNEDYTGSDPSKGSCHFYYVKADGTQKAIKLPKSGPNKYVYVSDTYGGDILWCGLVISNTSTSKKIYYTLKYHVERGTEQTLSLASNLRYYEKVENIGKGEYIDYHVTFATGGNKLIQTFGLKNTYLELYDGTTNAKLAEDDNSGVGGNAFISHSFTANKPYRIRLMYTTQPVSGETKFVIIPSTAYSTYANIPAYTNSTSDISGTYTQYQSNLISCKFTTEQTLTVHLQSNVDSYLYIINPRSTDPITQANNNSPDTTKDAEGLYNDDYNGIYSSQITKTMLANKVYLIIACKYSPSSSASGSYTISFD